MGVRGRREECMVMVHLLLLSTLLYGLAVGTDWQGQCVDNPGRIQTLHRLRYTNTPSTCITKCTRDGQPYAAVYGSDCRCFSVEGTQDTQVVAQGKCDYPCPGDPALTCGGAGGGGFYYNLYRTKSPATNTESTSTCNVLFMPILFSCLMVPFTLA